MKSDRDRFVMLLDLASFTDTGDVILLGDRCKQTFNSYFGEDIDWLESRVVHFVVPIRFWSIPTPNNRNIWYKDAGNRKAASDLLCRVLGVGCTTNVSDFYKSIEVMP